MKTKVRTLEVKSTIPVYKHTHIQILGSRYRKRNKNHVEYLNVIGEITFQGDNERDYWYGMSLSVTSGYAEEFLAMAKLVKKIRNSEQYDGGNIQPDTVKKIIGAEEYFHYHSNYIPVTDIGKNFYSIFKEGGEVWTCIPANNEKEAIKRMEGMNLGEGYKVRFERVIER